MYEFFVEGGWGMYTILAFGLVTVGAAVRFALTPERRALPFITAMSVTVAITTIHATWSDLAAVFNAVSKGIAPGSPPDQVMLFEGLKECTRPGSFAGLFLTLAWLFVSVGLLRGPRETVTRA